MKNNSDYGNKFVMERLKGQPNFPDNKAIVDYFMLKYPKGIHYAKYKNSALIKVTIVKIATWNNGGREYIDFKEKTAYRIG